MACSSPCRGRDFLRNYLLSAFNKFTLDILVGLRCSTPKSTSHRAICCNQSSHRWRYGILLQQTILKHFLGFYGVTYYIGFREDFDVNVGIIFFFLLLLWHFDCGFRARNWLKIYVAWKGCWILEFQKQFFKRSDRLPNWLLTCGFCGFFEGIFFILLFPSAPHYHVVSRKVDVGYMSPAVNYLRAFLIEGVYRRLCRFSKVLQILCPCWNSFFHSYYVPGNSQLVDTCRRVSPYSYNLHPKTNRGWIRIIHVGINATIWFLMLGGIIGWSSASLDFFQS